MVRKNSVDRGIRLCNNALHSSPYLVDFEGGLSFCGPQVNIRPSVGMPDGERATSPVGGNVVLTNAASAMVFPKPVYGDITADMGPGTQVTGNATRLYRE